MTFEMLQDMDISELSHDITEPRVKRSRIEAAEVQFLHAEVEFLHAVAPEVEVLRVVAPEVQFLRVVAPEVEVLHVVEKVENNDAESDAESDDSTMFMENDESESDLE